MQLQASEPVTRGIITQIAHLDMLLIILMDPINVATYMLCPFVLQRRPLELVEVPDGDSEALLMNGWAESLSQQQLPRQNLVSPYH